MRTYMNNIKIDLLYYFHSKALFMSIIVAIVLALLQISNLNSVANTQLDFYEECYEDAIRIGLNPEITQYNESGIENNLFDDSVSLEGKNLGDNVAGAHQLAEARIFMLMPKTFTSVFINQHGIGILVLLIAIITTYCFGNDYDNKTIKLRVANSKSYEIMISKYISSIVITVISLFLILVTVYIVSLINHMSFDSRGISIGIDLFAHFKYNLFNGILVVLFNSILFTSIIQLLIIIFKNRTLPIIIVFVYAMMPSLGKFDIKTLATDLVSHNQALAQFQDYSLGTDFSVIQLILILTGVIIIIELVGEYIFKLQSKYIT